MTGTPSLTLLLSPADRLPAGSPDRRTLTSGSLTIGRGPDNDWVLPDPERLLSKHHCTIGFDDGRYTLADTSTNGVYVNGSGQPLGRGNSTVLHDGDRLALGDYRIAVSIAAASEAPEPVDWGQDEKSDPFGLNAGWSGPAPGGLSGPGFGASGPRDPLSSGLLNSNPLDIDPLSAPPASDWSRQRPVSHMPETADAFTPPALTPAVVPTPIPPDWQARPETLTPASLPAGNPHRPEALNAGPERPTLHSPDSLAGHTPVPSPAPPAPGGPMAAALDRFLDGAGLDGLGLGEAEAAALLRDLGESFRAMVAGLREVLRARTLLKQEFRAEATVIRATENNPLKFSGSLDEAIAGLVRRRGPGYLPPREAVAEAMRDIKAHQVATVTGMQVALGAMLEEFDPANLSRRLGSSALIGLVPGARRAKLWALYEDLYKEISAEVEDSFRGRFGREFARAYDEQSRRMK